MAEKIILTVDGMSCGHCVKTVKTALSALEGVQEVTVDLTAKQVAVSVDQQLVVSKQIAAVIDDCGFTVVRNCS